jgi:hypothetical protein
MKTSTAEERNDDVDALVARKLMDPEKLAYIRLAQHVAFASIHSKLSVYCI